MGKEEEAEGRTLDVSISRCGTKNGFPRDKTGNRIKLFVIIELQDNSRFRIPSKKLGTTSLGFCTLRAWNLHGKLSEVRLTTQAALRAETAQKWTDVIVLVPKVDGFLRHSRPQYGHIAGTKASWGEPTT